MSAPCMAFVCMACPEAPPSRLAMPHAYADAPVTL